MADNQGQLPMGAIVPFLLPVGNIPQGWLLCDGSPIPVEYQDFIAAIGGKNTPNLAGLTLIGAGAGSQPMFPPGTQFHVGDIGGEPTHTLSIDEMPSHTHTYVGEYGYDIYDQNGDDVHLMANSPPQDSGPAGAGAPHNNMQPYYAVNFIVYAGNGVGPAMNAQVEQKGV